MRIIRYNNNPYKKKYNRRSVKINIAFAGGQCTGKSTAAMFLAASQKEKGYDYDYIGEESRKLRREFGHFKTPFERFYMWVQQEREEVRSTAKDGFITDAPLIQLYAGARVYSRRRRDMLAVRELFRACQGLHDRYHLMVIAEDPEEIPYKTDGSRSAEEAIRKKKHQVVRSFVEHLWPEKLLLVKGNARERVETIERKVEALRNTREGIRNVPF